jgi:hypothetical protein
VFARAVFDDAPAWTARTAQPTRSSAARTVLGLTLLLLVGVLGTLVYRDHAQLRVRAADVIESAVAFASTKLVLPVSPPTIDAPREPAEVRSIAPTVEPVAPAPAPAPAPTTANEPPIVAPIAEPSAPPTAVTAPKPPAPEQAAEPAAPPAEPQVAVPTEPSQFTFTERSITVGEGETSARIVIRRTGSLAEKESVVWWTANRSALADEDYAVLGARIETFAPGEEVRVVHVPLIADSLPEQRESFVVNLRAERPGAASAAQVEVTILDDDS